MATVTYVVAYDICDDRRRARVSAKLQSVADRIQQSVFLLVIDPQRLDGVIAEVEGRMDLDEDSLFVFPQCGSCWERMIKRGQASPVDDVTCWISM